MRVLVEKTVLVAALFLLFSGCQAKMSRVRPPLEQEGAVFLFLEPLPMEADRLAFDLERISAISENKGEVPLALLIRDLSSRTINRERLLASGELSPGRYSGFALVVKAATLSGTEGESALKLPEGPVRIDFPFEVRKKKAVVLSLTLRFAESVREGFLFSPEFSVMAPRRPVGGTAAIVANRGGNTVTVFDKTSGRVAGIIPSGGEPGAIAIDLRLQRAYLAISGDDVVEVIDILSEEVIDRIRLLGGDRPQGLALTPGGRTLLTSNPGSNTVTILDPQSLTELARINVGTDPQSLLLDQTGRRAYVFNTGSNTISVIDVPDRVVAATIPTEPGPLWGQLNRNGDRLYVIHRWSPYLSVIDPFTFTVLEKKYVGMGACALKVDTNTNMIYLAREHGTEVEVYDPFSLVASDVLRTGGQVAYMTIDGELNNLVLLMPERKSVRMINLIRKEMTGELDTGDDPYWVTLTGER